MLPPDFSNGSDDLGAFENYVSSLVSQKNIMTDIISETKIELGDKFLINLMTKTLSKAQVTDGIITYGLSDVPFPTVCCIITYRDYRELQNLLSTDGLNEVRVTIHNILDESFRTRAFFKLIDIDAQTIAAVSSTDKGEDFAALLKKEPNAVLLLVGGGEDMPKIQAKAHALGIAEHVRFLGVRSDVADLMQAMDVFVFPSLYEGLGIVLIEAQAAGLPCVVSNTIPREAYLTDLVTAERLSSSTETWADNILEKRNFPRTDRRAEIAAHGFDITTEAVKLQEFYINAYEQNC